VVALVPESEQKQTGDASGAFHVTLMLLHFVERLCVTDVGDVEPFYLSQGSLIMANPRKNPTKVLCQKSYENLQLG
jgi:hypothetical protein